MITRPDRSSRPGPFIRQLDVPEEDVPLRPARLRPGRRLPRLPRRLYGTALAAWTLGLLAATFGLLHEPGGHERHGAASAEPALPLPAPAASLDGVKDAGRP